MGFSLNGALIVAAILAPNLFLMIFPPRRSPERDKGAGILFTFLERLGQAGCFILPVISRDYFKQSVNAWFVIMTACIFAYWALWIRYAVKREFKLLFEPLLFIPVPMAVLPVAAFASAVVWGESPWLGIACAALAAGHITNSLHFYKYLTEKAH